MSTTFRALSVLSRAAGKYWPRAGSVGLLKTTVVGSQFKVPTCNFYLQSTALNEWIKIEDRPQYGLDKDAFTNALKEENTYFIDVREKAELEEGKIDAHRYINIPLGFLWPALELCDKDFKAEYGIEKPSKDDKIVFVCLAGVRSTWALQIAQVGGYKNSQHYMGGYYQWATGELFPLPEGN
uniref:thiosulfate sulfurtransferase/rhodanese-like domain-containing protein 3 n=1 Tax=Ciona intestinalis TaxID=7719 RepID=UPI000521723A|nr:thiosulfate sulfurtransferase/rhodanese-like domain-containing protein 3 [Ciona intestinalis]|eukprot:XP_009857709.1 thiosulfate sulfurtransferase/rhodanese-like domain-containing protein 3 [Ciona intestinalis]